MTVFKYFLKTALRQKWIIIGYTGIFLVLSVINGANTDTKEVVFTEKGLNIGIVDKSHSDISIELTRYLDQSNILITMEEDIDYIKEQVFLEALDAVILIPENFTELVIGKEKSIEIFRDDRRMGPLQIENQINKFLIFANATYRENQYDLSKVKMALGEEAKVELLKQDNISTNGGASTWFKYYFNFTGYIIIAIYVAVIGLIMAEFNSKNIQDRMKISSKKFLQFNTEMYLGQVILGILITSIFVMGSITLKGKHLSEVNFIKHLINIYVFSFSILCFTFLINNLTTNRFIINGISTVASLGTAFISGILVPQEFLGEKVLAIAKFFPTYYFVRVNDMKVGKLFDIRYELLMQILFGAVFLSLGLYFSKVKQKS